MTTALVTVVPGSIQDTAQKTNKSISESFLSADVMVIVDVSASMATRDGRDGQSRYAVACTELAKLQKDLPGRIAVVAFSNKAQFMPGGIPLLDGGGTDLAAALQFAHMADGTMKFFVISDGEPNSEEEALRAARQFTSPISTIYVGPRGGDGSEFMKRLAQKSGGQTTTAERAYELADAIGKLLIAAG